jgi:hypothetical protein
MTMAYQIDQSGYIRDQKIAHETVVVSEKECHGLVSSMFVSGTLRLAQAKYGPVIVQTTVVDSDVIAVKRQKDYRLFKARFLNCRFHGVFSGVDFGHTDDLEDGFGAVENCDFTDATLAGCRFLNVDTSTLRLPSWPHVVIIDPYKRAADVAAMQWPGQLGLYMEGCTNRPESFKATVLHVPSLASLVKCTEDEIKAAFEKFGGLMM